MNNPNWQKVEITWQNGHRTIGGIPQNGQMIIFTMAHLGWGDKGWQYEVRCGRYDEFAHVVKNEYPWADMIAWMPMPKPYTIEDEEKTGGQKE